MKKILFYFLLIFASVIFAITLCEIYLRFFGEKRFDLAHQLSKRKNAKKTISLLFDSNLHTKHDFFHEGKLIFREEIETDEFGRRRSLPAILSKNLVLFFGCSYTFGTGLQQAETLPSIFSKKSGIDSFNYAMPGFSPSSMLKQITELSLEQQIPKHYESIYAYYLFYGFQWRRTLGSLTWIAKRGGVDPLYEYDAETRSLKNKGSFSTGRPFSTYLFYLMGHLHLTSYIPDYSPVAGKDYEKNLFCSIMNASYRELNKKLRKSVKNLKVVFPQFDEDTKWALFLKEAKECLEKEVQVMYLRINGAKSDWMIDPILEDHPSVRLNEVVAEKLISQMDH
ncbi:hypothetical protein K2X05_02785 [bacterium]|nr:hypothetical protein [bacterium]